MQVGKMIKKVDRAVNKNDYERLRDTLNSERAQVRLLKPQVQELKELYQNVKNSPQAASVELQLRAKEKELQYSQDKLNMLNTAGRKELNTDPDAYKIQQASNAARADGFGIGGAVGGALGLGLGAATANAFNEGEHMSFKDRIGTELEEAGKTFNPSYSKTFKQGLDSAAKNLPGPLGGDSAKIQSAKIQQNRDNLAASIRAARKEGNQGRAQAEAMSARTSPNATIKNHPMYEKLRGGGLLRAPMADGDIRNIAEREPGLFKTNKPNYAIKHGKDIYRNTKDYAINKGNAINKTGSEELQRLYKEAQPGIKAGWDRTSAGASGAASTARDAAGAAKDVGTDYINNIAQSVQEKLKNYRANRGQ